MNLYDFTVKAQDGTGDALSRLAGKVALIVNTATGCGFTPQYIELQKLYEELNGQGLEILDFPCNQFGGQAPGTDEEIYSFCSGRFGITFPQYSKLEVNGENAAPLYRWLTENTVFGGFEGPAAQILAPIAREMDAGYESNGRIKWNFTKFLIGRDGAILARFEPTAPMERVREAVLAAL